MRAFSWKYFTLTGDVDAYLLYNDVRRFDDRTEHEDEYPEEDQPEFGLDG